MGKGRRWLGAAIAAGVLAGCVGAMVLGGTSFTEVVLPVVCSAFLLWVYLLVVNDRWVRIADERYADRLLASPSATR